MISSVCVQLLERKKQRNTASNGLNNNSPLTKKPHLGRAPVGKSRGVALENPAIKSARNSWELGINEELLAIATEKDRSFALLM